MTTHRKCWGGSQTRAYISIGFLSLLAAPLFASRVEIRDNRFYVDNEPFYVRAVGYAPWRPHQHPGISYADTNRRWTELDFERIAAAHFNTVRTWDALAPEELLLAEKYGLMVLQGIRLDPRQDFSDPRNQESCLALARTVAENSKDHSNVLGYLIMSEPWPTAVVDTGESETQQFFRRMKRAIQVVDPRPVSMDSWVPLAFLEDHEFDFATFNLYAFWPGSLNYALGFPGLVRWFADHFAAERPLIVGETGGYSVSKTSVTASGGYGGLTEYDQSLKDLESLRGTIQGHAAGSVLVSWIDNWHYPRDADTHDDEPWEWNGILAIPTDSKKEMKGIPREVYADVGRYNEAVLVEPKAGHYYPVNRQIPIQVFAPGDIARVRFNINGGEWQPLNDSGHGAWQGFFKLPKLAKKYQKIHVEALDRTDAIQAAKEVTFLAAMEPEQVGIELKAPSGGKAPIHFTVKVSDGKRQPVAQRKVFFGCFYPISFHESQGMATTDAAGEITVTCTAAPETRDRYLFVAAGTDSPERVRSGDMRIYKLGS